MRIWLFTLPLILSLSACSKDEQQATSTQDSAAQKLVTTEAAPIEQTLLEPQAPAAQDIETLKAQLEQLTQDKPCQQSAECRVLPVGHRACGGPDGFVIFSTQNNDAQTIENIVETISNLQRQRNIAEQRMSICQHLTVPAAQCIANQCTAVDIQQEAM